MALIFSSASSRPCGWTCLASDSNPFIVNTNNGIVDAYMTITLWLFNVANWEITIFKKVNHHKSSISMGHVP